MSSDVTRVTSYRPMLSCQYLVELPDTDTTVDTRPMAATISEQNNEHDTRRDPLHILRDKPALGLGCVVDKGRT